jgi:autotransporter-associated beta strand protein
VAGSSTINVSSGKTVEITDTLSGSGSLTKSGAGTLRLSGTNTYSGTIAVSAGSLVVQFASGLATSATFTNTTLSVAFSGNPSSGATYTLLPGPTAQSYGSGSVTLTGTSATATYNSATSVLTIN